MSAPLPFHVSPEAEDYLRRVSMQPDKEVGISVASGFTIYNRERQMTDSYEGLHFFVGWHEPGVWSGILAEIAGRKFCITPPTVGALRGKTLTLIHRYEGERQPGRVRDLLVAA